MRPADKRQIALKLARLAGNKPQDSRGWAEALRRRELGGENLTPAQRRMWRDALRAGAPLPTDGDGAEVDYAAAERRQAEQQRIRQYAAERGIAFD